MRQLRIKVLPIVLSFLMIFTSFLFTVPVLASNNNGDVKTVVRNGKERVIVDTFDQEELGEAIVDYSEENNLEQDEVFLEESFVQHESKSARFIDQLDFEFTDVYPSESEDALYYTKSVYDHDTLKYYRLFYKYDLDLATSFLIAETPHADHEVEFYYQSDRFYCLIEKWVKEEARTQNTFFCIDMLSGETEELCSVSTEYSFWSFVVDEMGRFFCSRYQKILVFDSDGSFLAESPVIEDQTTLIGVDSSNGNIYYQGTCNWKYWGYDHEMDCLKVARLNSDGTISINENDNYISIFYQTYFYEHTGCVELFSGKYLADLSTFLNDTLYLLDSSLISPEEVTEGSTSISLTGGGPSVSGVNLENEDAVVLAVKTLPSLYDNHQDVSSIGPRCAYFAPDNREYLLAATQEKSITAYDLAAKTKVGTFQMAYPVYKLMNVNNKLVVIEKNGNGYCVETFMLTQPSSVEIKGPANIKVGETGKFEVVFDSDMLPCYSFSSSNSAVLSVDEKGNASAWASGTAEVTVATEDGTLSNSLAITVSPKEKTKKNQIIKVEGSFATSNVNYNNYYNSSYPVESYLTEIDDSTLMRTESLNVGFLVEYWDRNGTLLSSKVIDREAPGILGFFAGTDAYFIVFGWKNTEEDNEKTVLRIVKYDKNWTRLSACDIKAINTRIPTDAGSLRMAEYNGILYIHTCHEMYQSEDGLCHQANMTFEINESDMSLKNSFSDVMNLSYGYVSHSFNQYIQIRDGFVYRVDHGDAYPRGIALTRYPVTGEMTSPDWHMTLVKFDGNIGDNYTGAQVGGFELSSTHAIVAYAQDLYNTFDGHVNNIKTCTLDYETGEVKIHEITDYSDSSVFLCMTPQLVKITDGHFLLFWEEYNAQADSYRFNMVRLDNTGAAVSDIIHEVYFPSDCQPILTSDDMVCWYMTYDGTVTLYQIDPFAGPGEYFTDVQNPKIWYYDTVYKIASTYNKNGKPLMSGYANGTNYFGPADPLTRQDFAVILYRLADEPEVEEMDNPFTDTQENGYYYNCVLWAKAENVIAGYNDGRFGVGDKITREQVATILYRFAKDYLKIDTSAALEAGDLSKFNDGTAVSDWAEEALKWATGAGVISGKDNGTRVDARGNAARAEIGAMILRFISYIQAN